jgi:hypothetical protein
MCDKRVGSTAFRPVSPRFCQPIVNQKPDPEGMVFVIASSAEQGPGGGGNA